MRKHVVYGGNTPPLSYSAAVMEDVEPQGLPDVAQVTYTDMGDVCIGSCLFCRKCWRATEVRELQDRAWTYSPSILEAISTTLWFLSSWMPWQQLPRRGRLIESHCGVSTPPALSSRPADPIEYVAVYLMKHKNKYQQLPTS